MSSLRTSSAKAEHTAHSSQVSVLLGSQKINDSGSVDDRTQVCCFSVFLFLLIISLNFIQ